MEAEQSWETYGVGGTCISGTHNLFVAAVDGDSVKEIITGGLMYNIINGSRTTVQAPLDIWSWNGKNVTLEATAKWPGGINSIFAADVNNDNIMEIITGGVVINDTSYYSILKIWHYSNGELSQKAQYEGIPANAIFVSDVDSDGASEIITVGRLPNDTLDTSLLCLWHFKDNTLSLIGQLELDVANVTYANSVFACDLDNNGNVEIITAGYSDNLNNSKGQLCIWQWNVQEFSLKCNENWQLITQGYALTIAGAVQGNTIVNNVKAGDVDGDGAKEIVTGGFTYDGEQVNAQLKIWNWTGNALTQEESEEWTTDYLTEVKCIALDDADGDGKLDIINSGIAAAKGSFANTTANPDRGQLRISSWNGTTWTLTQSVDWVVNDGVCAWNVATGDVDKDGITEIITVGCTAIGKLCDPNMRIWSIPNVNSFSYYFTCAIAGAATATAIVIVIFFVRKTRKHPQ
ncbi:VCBS repeat-containing protein [Candidatus Bathyarchaeota archaeon]|nr:VCBS repeat-containing protein [Candidatus Bathyarchaeota archaeon]